MDIIKLKLQLANGEITTEEFISSIEKDETPQAYSLNVKQTLALISKMDTILEIETILKDETRKTVLDFAAKRINTLSQI